MGWRDTKFVYNSFWNLFCFRILFSFSQFIVIVLIAIKILNKNYVFLKQSKCKPLVKCLITIMTAETPQWLQLQEQVISLIFQHCCNFKWSLNKWLVSVDYLYNSWLFALQHARSIIRDWEKGTEGGFSEIRKVLRKFSERSGIKNVTPKL